MAIEQTSQSVKFLAFFVASGSGLTGASVSVDVYDPSGTQIVTGAAATEVGGGLYSYTLAGTETGSEGEYVAVFHDDGGNADQVDVPSLWTIGRGGVEHLDADVSSRSSHDDPDLSNLDTAVSTRSSHDDPDPNGHIDAAISSRSTFDPTADEVTVGDLTSAAIQKIWDRATSALTTAGSIGKRIVDNLNATVSSRSSHSEADAADAIWDEPMSDHTSTGSTGEKLDASGSSADPLLNDVPGDYQAGTAGAALGKISTGKIQAVGPVIASDGRTVEIVQGDDYTSDSGQTLRWTVPNGELPDLTGATATWTAREQYGGSQEIQKSVAISVGSSETTFEVELTATETDGMNVGGERFEYDIEITLNNGAVQTILRGGKLTVLSDVT